MTDIETDRVLNAIPSKEVENDWSFEDLATAKVIEAPKEVPPSYDLRQAWWGVSDQESTGSCVGWASADGVLRWHFVNRNRLSKDDHLSARFQWMASKEMDEFVKEPTVMCEIAGTSVKQSLEIAKKYGCIPESLLPFKTNVLFQGNPTELYAIANRLRIDSYVQLSNLTQWKPWLASSGPIIGRIDVDSNFLHLKGDRSGKLVTYNKPDRPAGHAVTVVGYRQDEFIIRNSWGKNWGDDGFAYASTDYVKAAFSMKWTGHPEWLEAYGVVVH